MLDPSYRPAMLKLYGFSASNYYNVPKLVLLEKGIPFEEVRAWTGASDTFQPEYLELSPMGKVPCLLTDAGPISESRCIADYLEATHPEPPLLPADPYQRALVNELCVMIDLYLELPARRALGHVFAGKPASERLRDEVLPILHKAAKALARRTTFEPYLVGDRFTLADVAGAIHFPAVRGIAKAAFGEDVLADVPGLDDYLARMDERETVKRVRADAAENRPEFFAFIRERYGNG